MLAIATSILYLETVLFGFGYTQNDLRAMFNAWGKAEHGKYSDFLKFALAKSEAEEEEAAEYDSLLEMALYGEEGRPRDN